MKVAISVTSTEANANLSLRFGRAPAFVVVDTDADQRQFLPNPAQQARGGAGIQAAELLVKQGVEAVISGAFGPKASNVLQAANIGMYQAQSGSLDELVSSLLRGDLKAVEEY